MSTRTNYNALAEFVSRKNVYVTELPGIFDFTWRLLSLDEWEILARLRERNIFDHISFFYMIFERCYQRDPNLIPDEIPIGIMVGIGEYIYTLSGPSDIESERELLSQARTFYASDSLVEFMKRTIYIAFEEISWEQLNSYNKLELFNKFVIAESILAQSTGYQPIDLSNIKTAEELAKEKKPSGTIDWEAENRLLKEMDADIDTSSPSTLPLNELRILQERHKSRQG